MIRRALAAALVSVAVLLTTHDSSAQRSSVEDLVKVEVGTLLVNEQERSVLLVLKPVEAVSAGEDPDARRVLPLVIGLEEARSISAARYQITPPRPLSHDLMKRIIEEYGGTVVSCAITKMEQATFYAELRLKRGGRELTIDCRPSDAIALALRSRAPIFVRRDVMRQHAVDPNKPDSSEKTLKT